MFLSSNFYHVRSGNSSVSITNVGVNHEFTLDT
jgi:hypothetical protein